MAEHDLQAVAFPTLDEAQVATLGSCAGASLTKYRAGQTLFRCGDRDAKFFIVKSGQVEIRDETGNAPKVVVVHKHGEFTGEAGQLTGRPAVVTAVAQTDCEVYPVSLEALRHILNRCPDLGDLILQAFIARQQLLRESAGFTGLRVIGSRYSHDTFRVRDFLARNRIWFTWLDLESDPQVNQLLKQFGVTEADTPVVACGHMMLLRNPSNSELAEAIGIRKPLDQQVYDLVVVGAGPAGLAAAVYGAPEGLSTVVLECIAPGGQAGSSMRIENYLGLPGPAARGNRQHRGAAQHGGQADVRRSPSDHDLTTIEIVNSKTGQTQVLEAAALFSFIGAVPRTDWLPKEIEIDSKGFVRTGPALAQSPTWGLKRSPFLLETSRPGVFAAGDVRSGSVKRIASAVGEGAMAVQFVHEYLKEM